MYEVHPPAVYVHQRVLENEQAKKRMARLMEHIHPDDGPIVVDDEALNQISNDKGWTEIRGKRTGQWNLQGDPTIVFNLYTWESPETIRERIEKYPGLSVCSLAGAAAWTFRDGRGYYARRGTVCQNAWELHTAWGCLHRCDYCHIGNLFTIMLNIEETVERLPELIAMAPWQQLYKFDNLTDTITLEPELGASELLVSFFAQTDDKYLMLYTKSDNVDHLLDLDHRGHTIVSFTISSRTVAKEIEKATPSTSARIEAAAKVGQAGYVPRVRFSPIVPIIGWREEMTELIDTLFDQVRPDLITMDVLGWMNPAAIDEILDTRLLDPRFLEGMRALYREGPPGPSYYPTSKHIFPHDLRREIYLHVFEKVRRRDKKIRVSICNETIEMWDDLGELLGMAPENYVCGCGPTSVPGNPLFAV